MKFLSQYNKTVLTALGMDLAKRANAGQATFKVTKVATSADDLGDISVEQLERMTEIPNIMQYGTITDAEPLESDNAVIGVSLRFTNKGLNNGYKIRLVGLYVREAGQQQDILYAVTTAKEPEYMPDFKDQVLYRFNLQMYVVVGRAQSVSILVDDTTIVSVKNFNDYKTINDKRVDKNIQDIAQLRQDFEDNKDVVKENIANAGQVKTVTLNSSKRTPDESGNINLGDALLPSLTAITVGSDDVNIAYNSGKNKYTADITNALNKVLDGRSLTNEQKKSVLDGTQISYADIDPDSSGSDPFFYAPMGKDADYDSGNNNYRVEQSGLVTVLNQLHQKDSDLQSLIDTKANKSDLAGIDTVDTVKTVTDMSTDDIYLVQNGKDANVIPTIKSVKTSDTTLVSQEGLESVFKLFADIVKKLQDLNISQSQDISNIQSNYATKQWVTDNFMPKPYITNSSSTADTYSKAHPDQLVILTK